MKERCLKMLDAMDIKYFEFAVGSNIKTRNASDISAFCPICGDSKRGNKARLHLYESGTVTNVNCFNGGCPVENKTMYSFLRDFYPNLLENYKREMFQSNISKLSNEYENVFSEIEKAKPKDLQTLRLDKLFEPLNDDCLEFLNKRGIKYDPKKYGNWYYSKVSIQLGEEYLGVRNSIIIPLYFENRIYGFYSRRLDKKQFFTYIHTNVGYKVWNLFNVDLDKPVYIFEGIFDAIASGLDNVVACMGAKINQERLDEMKQPIFVLDNDKTGLLNSLKYSKGGYPVYVQPSEYPEKDMNDFAMVHGCGASVIKDNIFSGIVAQVKIKQKL